MVRPLPAVLLHWMATQPPVSFAKGAVLLRSDETPAHVWYLQTGLVSLFSLDAEGHRYNHEFLGAGDWAFGRLVRRNGRVCCAQRAMGVQALAPVVAVKVPVDLLDRWRATDTEVAAYLVEMLVEVAETGLGREADLVQRSVEQRYLDLLGKAPGIDKAVPQLQIASWLGVTPIALSRIRRRLGHTARV